MKAILMSDRAYWCMLMMNKKKKLEVRKGTALYKVTQKLIDKYGFAEFYVYCTKGKPNLWLPYEYDCFELDEASQPYLSDEPMLDVDTKMNGKVIFKFRCYKVEEIESRRYSVETYPYTETLDDYELLDKSCLTTNELENYLGDKNGCAIHISDLEIFDKPKELSEFYGLPKKLNTTYGSEMVSESLTKAPQSFAYIEV